MKSITLNAQNRQFINIITRQFRQRQSLPSPPQPLFDTNDFFFTNQPLIQKILNHFSSCIRICHGVFAKNPSYRQVFFDGFEFIGIGSVGNRCSKILIFLMKANFIILTAIICMLQLQVGFYNISLSGYKIILKLQQL